MIKLSHSHINSTPMCEECRKTHFWKSHFWFKIFQPCNEQRYTGCSGMSFPVRGLRGEDVPLSVSFLQGSTTWSQNTFLPIRFFFGGGFINDYLYLFLLHIHFFKYILLIMLLPFSQFFLLYPHSTLHPPTLQRPHPPHLAHVHLWLYM